MSLSSADTEPRPAAKLVGDRTWFQQKDNLCGPFHAARALRDAGVHEADGEPVDQDLVAWRAGTALPVRELGPQVPPGAVSWHEYRYGLALVEPEQAGTAPESLARAIEDLSDRRLVCVPLRGVWTGPRVERLVDEATAAGARLIANLRTGRLWGSRPPLDALLAELEGHGVAEVPTPDWDVGHYVELVHLVRGRAGALVLVRDSYPSLGWSGHHLQPPVALAAALVRGDGRGGGVLAVVAAGDQRPIHALASELGLDVGFWDN